MADGREPSLAAKRLAAEYFVALDHDALVDPEHALADLIQGVKDGAIDGAAEECDSYVREVHDIDSNTDAAKTLAERIRARRGT